jgi:hypothetical protein
VRAQIVSWLYDMELENDKYVDGPRVVKVVRPEPIVIDIELLKEDLSPEQIEKCEVRTFDLGRLESLVKLGEIDGKIVAKHAEKKPGTPYLRFS